MQALRDPDLPRNLEVFRGYRKARQFAEDSAAASNATTREDLNG